MKKDSFFELCGSSIPRATIKYKNCIMNLYGYDNDYINNFVYISVKYPNGTTHYHKYKIYQKPKGAAIYLNGYIFYLSNLTQKIS